MKAPPGERGSVSVVTAAVFVVLLICAMGLGDVARMLAARAQARTAADAAALAAAQELAVPSGIDPASFADEVARRNGAALVSCVCAAGSFDAIVTVERSVDGLWLVPGVLTLRTQARAVVDLP